MSSKCEKLIDWIMSYFDPHWESLGPKKRDEILVEAKQLFQAAILEVLRSDEGKAVIREVMEQSFRDIQTMMTAVGEQESEGNDDT